MQEPHYESNEVFLLVLNHEPKFMIKKVIISFLVLVIIFIVGCSVELIKRQPNNTMLDIALVDNRLDIQTEQSAKYISVDTIISHDTLGIKVYSNSLMNPIADKAWHKIIKICPGIKYVTFDYKTNPLAMFEKRQYY